MSRVGKAPITVPDKVKVTFDPPNLAVKGPKGSLNMSVSDQVNVDQIIQDLEEEERKAREAAERAAQEEARKNEITEQINAWKSTGLIVEKLESVMGEALDTIEPVFTEIQAGVEKLQELANKLGELDIKGFESAAESIKSKLTNPDLVGEIEKELSDLEENIKEQETRKDELNGTGRPDPGGAG